MLNRASVVSLVGGLEQLIWILIYDSFLKICDFACEKRQWRTLLWWGAPDGTACCDYYDGWSVLGFVLVSASGT